MLYVRMRQVQEEIFIIWKVRYPVYLTEMHQHSIMPQPPIANASESRLSTPRSLSKDCASSLKM